MTAECKRLSADHIGPNCSCTEDACALDVHPALTDPFEPIIDRDPGDENDRPSCQSYRATLERFLPNGLTRLVFHDIIASSFLEAVKYAEQLRADGDRLLNVRSLDGLDHVAMAHG